jgi:hypothetical protein
MKILPKRKHNAIVIGNHTKHVNTLCGENSELLIVKAGGIYSYSWTLKG